MLALFERAQRRRLAEWDRRHADAFRPYDLAAAEREAERIRALDARAADAMLLGARLRKSHEAKAFEALAAERRRLAEDLEDLAATRAALPPERLAEPYRIGGGRHRLPTAADAGRPLKRVVKLDPTFPWDGRHRARVQLITVCAPQRVRSPEYHPPMRDAVAAIDLARLAALLD